MTAIEKFQKHKDHLRYATHWAEMLGKEYHGGGGGFGKVVAVEMKRIELYYQEYNGATNYHPAPEHMAAVIAEVVKDRAKDIVNEALNRMQEANQQLAQAALKEHASLMNAAGLTDCADSAHSG